MVRRLSDWYFKQLFKTGGIDEPMRFVAYMMVYAMAHPVDTMRSAYLGSQAYKNGNVEELLEAYHGN